MENVVVVGMGDYFWNLLEPTLALMQNAGLIRVISTVDIRDKDKNKTTLQNNLEHRIRALNQPLSELLSDLRPYNPIVILGHFNELHTPDADDLLSQKSRVMVEKPYAINEQQLQNLDAAIKNNPGSISLLEYYLMMKSIPLLVLAGRVKDESFYFNENGVLKTNSSLRNPSELSGRLSDIAGKPLSVLVEILEGEGNEGKVDHRGKHLVDLNLGGGMVQDLGLHAVAPLFALEDYIGRIDKTFDKGVIKIAKSEEYAEWAVKNFKLEDKDIGETYAEIDFVTSTGIPIRLSVGKYVLGQKNRKRIQIVGSNSTIDYDLTNNRLHVPTKEGIAILECSKTNAKYYPVIRAGIEELKGNGQFYFEPVLIAFAAQELIINVLKRAKASDVKFYRTGASPDTIFTG